MHAPVRYLEMMRCGIAKKGYLLAQLDFLVSWAVRRTFFNNLNIRCLRSSEGSCDLCLRSHVLADTSPAHEAPRTD